MLTVNLFGGKQFKKRTFIVRFMEVEPCGKIDLSVLRMEKALIICKTLGLS